MMASLFAYLVSGLMFVGAAIGLRAYKLDDLAASRVSGERSESIPASPGRAALQMMTMEHALAAADLVWLRIIEEIGEVTMHGDGQAERMSHLSDTATDLDPRHYLAYYAPAIYFCTQVYEGTEAERIATRGEQALSDRWEFPFLIGFVRLFVLGHPLDAVEPWLRASKMPGSPRFLTSLAGRAVRMAGDAQGSIEMLESMLPSLSGPQKEDVVIRLKILKSEPTLVAQDAACTAFRKEMGRIPRDGLETRLLHLTDASPDDKFGRRIEFDDDCVARTSIIFTREDEAAQLQVGKFKRPIAPNSPGKSEPAN
jgi:hypothetical protein